jgi:hypothetical protein
MDWWIGEERRSGTRDRRSVGTRQRSKRASKQKPASGLNLATRQLGNQATRQSGTLAPGREGSGLVDHGCSVGYLGPAGASTTRVLGVSTRAVSPTAWAVSLQEGQ